VRRNRDLVARRWRLSMPKVTMYRRAYVINLEIRQSIAGRGVALALAIGLLNACSTTSSHWTDVTHRGRGQSEFVMDSGHCQLVSQGASQNQQHLVNEQNINGCSGSAAGCGTLGVLQGVNINQAGKNAYQACMNASGWMLVADPRPGEAPRAAQPPSSYKPCTADQIRAGTC